MDNKLQFLTCPACEGDGREKSGKICQNCGGAGLGVIFGSRFLYWKEIMNVGIARLRQAERTARKIVKYASLIFGLLGFASLIYWIWEFPLDHFFVYRFDSVSALSDLNPWNNRHWSLLIFWISISFWMFAWYRRKADKKDLAGKWISANDAGKSYPPNNWSEIKRQVVGGRGINVAQVFGTNAKEIVEDAYLLAAENGHARVEPVHIFASLCRRRSVVIMFSRLNADITFVEEKIKEKLSRLPVEKEKITMSPAVKEILIETYLDAGSRGKKSVDPLSFFLPCLTHDPEISEILFEIGVDRETADNVIAWFRINDQLVENYRLYRKMSRFKPGGKMDRAYTAVETKVLNHFSTDLTLAAKWGSLELCVERDKEIADIFRIWESGRPGVIMVGPPGVGKKNIAGGIAQLMVKEEVPAHFYDKRLISLDIARLLSGTQEESEERLLVALDEVAMSGNIILYLDNLAALAGSSSGGEQSFDLTDILASALEKHGFYCLADSTEEEFARQIERRSLASALSRVDVDEPEPNRAIRMIESRIGYIEAEYRVYFSYQAIKSAVEMSDKYQHDKYLPDKAVETLERAAGKAKEEKGEGALIGREAVAAVVSELTHVPVTQVTADEGQKLLRLETEIHEKMIGQTEAVDMVAASLRRARAQMRDDKRPIASFLFLGPTGVGKTQLAKTLANVYFGSEEYIVRLDMSEYQQPDSAGKMIGSPDGTPGYLTDAVRRSPFSLILLDEIEKAHPNILNLFLQVIDDGRLTDGQGRTVDFTNSIIIATSNIGANYIRQMVGEGKTITEIKTVLVNDHLMSVMRPELVNRFDGVIVFKPLSLEDVYKIAGIFLADVAKLLDSKGMLFRTDDEGVKKLAAAGFDPKFGARPLRRVIQEQVEDKISNLILTGELKRRDVVVIDGNGEVVVEKGREL